MCPWPRAWGLCRHRSRSHSARGGTARTLGLLEAQTSARGRSRSEGRASGAARDLCATFPYKGDRPAHLGSRRCLRFKEGWGSLRCQGGARGLAPPPGTSTRDRDPAHDCGDEPVARGQAEGRGRQPFASQQTVEQVQARPCGARGPRCQGTGGHMAWAAAGSRGVGSSELRAS